ncbi:hypothetical protein DMUE_1992 [Dictyocoela muelleri]|nr:hypothetical protein DMUE_1992 [Dictyocoela muelleri]
MLFIIFTYASQHPSIQEIMQSDISINECINFIMQQEDQSRRFEIVDEMICSLQNKIYDLIKMTEKLGPDYVLRYHNEIIKLYGSYYLKATDFKKSNFRKKRPGLQTIAYDKDLTFYKNDNEAKKVRFINIESRNFDLNKCKSEGSSNARYLKYKQESSKSSEFDKSDEFYNSISNKQQSNSILKTDVNISTLSDQHEKYYSISNQIKDQLIQNSDQLNQNSDQLNQNSDQLNQNSDQLDQSSNQLNQNSDQSIRNGNQSIQNSDEYIFPNDFTTKINFEEFERKNKNLKNQYTSQFLLPLDQIKINDDWKTKNDFKDEIEIINKKITIDKKSTIDQKSIIDEKPTIYEKSTINEKSFSRFKSILHKRQSSSSSDFQKSNEDNQKSNNKHKKSNDGHPKFNSSFDLEKSINYIPFENSKSIIYESELTPIDEAYEIRKINYELKNVKDDSKKNETSKTKNIVEDLKNKKDDEEGDDDIIDLREFKDIDEYFSDIEKRNDNQNISYRIECESVKKESILNEPEFLNSEKNNYEDVNISSLNAFSSNSDNNQKDVDDGLCKNDEVKEVGHDYLLRDCLKSTDIVKSIDNVKPIDNEIKLTDSINLICDTKQTDNKNKLGDTKQTEGVEQTERVKQTDNKNKLGDMKQTEGDEQTERVKQTDNVNLPDDTKQIKNVEQNDSLNLLDDIKQTESVKSIVSFKSDESFKSKQKDEIKYEVQYVVEDIIEELKVDLNNPDDLQYENNGSKEKKDLKTETIGANPKID